MRLTKNIRRDTGPDRPTHFNQDVNEYTQRRDQTEQDFATEEDKAVTTTGFPPVAEPVPVILVESPPRARILRRALLNTYTLDSGVDRLQQIASDERMRVRLFVRNLDDADSAFLALSGMDKNQSRALELPAGKDIEMFHNVAVWAFCATSTVKIAVEVEMEVEQL